MTRTLHELCELHNRMPVIIEPQDQPAWLGEVEDDLATLLRPSGDVLKVWPMSKQVNSPRNKLCPAQSVRPPRPPLRKPSCR